MNGLGLFRKCLFRLTRQAKWLALAAGKKVVVDIVPTGTGVVTLATSVAVWEEKMRKKGERGREELVALEDLGVGQHTC